MKNVIYQVPAIHCAHCMHTIKMELSELMGIKDVQIDVDKKEVNVSYEPPADDQSIKDLLIEINYPPEG